VNTEVIQKQRELEHFLLGQQLKRLRGTTWKYFDIVGKSNASTTEVGAATAPVNTSITSGSVNSSTVATTGVSGLTNSTNNVAIAGVSVGSPGSSSGSKDVIVVLHGGGIRPEAMFEQLTILSTELRVIAPLFPEELNEFEDYAAGIILIMEKEKVKRAHFYGLSFGGLVASYFLYRYPEKVISLVVSHASISGHHFNEKCEKILKRGEECPKWLRRIMTGALVKPKNLDRDIPDISIGEKELWLNILKKFGASKQELIARTEALVDYHTNIYLNLSPEDFNTPTFTNQFSGSILILESEDEPFFSKKEAIESAKRILPSTPRTTFHFFKGTGHLYSLVRGSTIVDIVLKFLQQQQQQQNNVRGQDDELTSPSSFDHQHHDTSITTSFNDLTLTETDSTTS